MNKKLKLLTVATSALFAFGSNAWGVDVEDGATLPNIAVTHEIKKTGAAPAAPATVILDATKGTTPNALALTKHATVSDAYVKVTGAIDKAGLKLHNDYFNVVKSFIFAASGDGFVSVSLDSAAPGTSINGGFLSAVASGTKVIDATHGNQKIEFAITNTAHGITDKVKKGWVDYGTDAAKKSDLKISGAAAASFEADYDFTYVNELLVDLGGNALTLNNADAVKVPAVIRFVNNANDSVTTFKVDTVLPAVYYTPADKSLTKGGAAGLIVATDNLTINTVGEAGYALNSISSAAGKTLTFGTADKGAYVSHVTIGGAKSVNKFLGNKLNSFDNAGKPIQTELNFNAADEGVFEVIGKDAELMVTAVGMSATPGKESKIKITEGAKLTGTAAFDFTDGVIEIAKGTLTVANEAAAAAILGTVTLPATASAEISVVATAVKAQPNVAMINTTAFKFTAEKQIMNLTVADTKTAAHLNALKGHTVTFGEDKAGQNFVVKTGSYVRLKPDWKVKSDVTQANSITVEKDATLVGYYDDFAVGLGASAELGLDASTSLAVGAADAQTRFIASKKLDKFTHSLIAKSGATLKLDARDSAGTATNYAPAIFGTVKFEGDVTLAANTISTIYANKFDADAASVKLHGNIALGSKNSPVRVKEVLPKDDKSANKLTMVATKLQAEKVATSFASAYDVEVGEFYSESKGQTLDFVGRGDDKATVATDNQVVKANIVKGGNSYDKVQIGGNGTVKFTGDISGNSVKTLLIKADDNKTVTMDTGLIEVGALKFEGTTDKGAIKFTKEIKIDSDVVQSAVANTASILEFAENVTFKKKFDDNHATVTAKKTMSVHADVTMKALEAKDMVFATKSKVTTDDKVTGLNSIAIGSNEVTFIKAIEASDLTLTFGGAKLISNDKITLKKVTVDAISKDATYTVGTSYPILEGTQVVIDEKNATGGNEFFTLSFVKSSDDKKLEAKVIKQYALGDVYKSTATATSSDEQALNVSNLNVIDEFVNKNPNSAMKALRNAFVNIKLKEGADAMELAAPASVVVAAQALNIAGKLVDFRTDFAAATAVASGSPADAEGMSIWAEAVYGGGEQKKDVAGTEKTSYKNSLYGVVGGADYKISDSSLFGIAVGGGKGEMTYEDTKAKAEVSGFVGMVYAAQNFGDAFFSEKAGFARFDAERSFKREGDVKASSTPLQYFAGVTAGYNVKAGDIVNIAPMVKMSFENGIAFDEKESGDSTVTALGTIKNEDRKSLIASFGGKISFNLQASEEMSIAPDLHGFGNFDLLASGEKEGSFKFAMGSDALEIKSAKAERFSADGGVGLTAKSVAGFEVGAKLDVQYREKYLGWMGALKLKLQF